MAIRDNLIPVRLQETRENLEAEYLPPSPYEYRWSGEGGDEAISGLKKPIPPQAKPVQVAQKNRKWEEVGPVGGKRDDKRKWEEVTGKPPEPAKKAATPEAPVDMQQEILGAVAEPLLAMASGAVAGPASNVAGLAAIPLHAAGLIKDEPADVQAGVRNALQFQPRTKAGASEWNPLNAIPHAIGSILDWAGKQAGGAIMPDENAPPTALREIQRGVGRGVEEAVKQAPAVAGPVVGKLAAGKIPAKQAALDVEKSLAKPLDDIRDAAHASGYKTPPEGGLKAMLSGVSGKARTEKALSVQNAENAAKKLGSEVGVKPTEPLSDDVFDARKEVNYGKYKQIGTAIGTELKVTDRFRQKIDEILQTAEANKDVTPELADAAKITQGFKNRITPEPETSLPGMKRETIAGTIEKAAASQPGAPLMRTLEQVARESPGAPGYGGAEPGRGLSWRNRPRPAPAMPFTAAPSPTLNTKWVMGQISDLRKRAKTDYRLGKDDAGSARMTIANELEKVLEENIGERGPQLLQEFKGARKNLAKIHLLEQVTDVAGRVDLHKLGALSERPQYRGVLDGEFKTAADFAKTWGKAAQKPTGEAVPRVSVFDGLLAASSVGATALGHAWGPALASELAVRLAVPKAAEMGLLQKRTPSYKAGTKTAKAAGPAGVAASTAAAQEAAAERARKRRERMKKKEE